MLELNSIKKINKLLPFIVAIGIIINLFSYIILRYTIHYIPFWELDRLDLGVFALLIINVQFLIVRMPNLLVGIFLFRYFNTEKARGIWFVLGLTLPVQAIVLFLFNCLIRNDKIREGRLFRLVVLIFSFVAFKFLGQLYPLLIVHFWGYPTVGDNTVLLRSSLVVVKVFVISIKVLIAFAFYEYLKKQGARRRLLIALFSFPFGLLVPMIYYFVDMFSILRTNDSKNSSD